MMYARGHGEVILCVNISVTIVGDYTRSFQCAPTSMAYMVMMEKLLHDGVHKG